MINHFRTVLRHRDSDVSDFSQPGGVFVPTGYKAPLLPSVFTKSHAILFGTNPDALMRNYRLAQYMHLLHTLPFAVYVTQWDPRITYDSAQSQALITAAFGETIRMLRDTVIGITSDGDITPETAAGQLYHEWLLSVLNSTTISVTRLAPTAYSEAISLTVTDGISAPFTLPGSTRTEVLDGITTGAQWHVSHRTRPRLSIGQVEQKLRASLSAAELSVIFSSSAEDLRRIWDTHNDMAYRLCALLVAWVDGAENIRTGGT